MVIGDFNASYWHPDFRRMLDAGLVDAHTALGKGFSTIVADRSTRSRRSSGSTMRSRHLTSCRRKVADFEIPGSDHRGFIVTVVPAR